MSEKRCSRCGGTILPPTIGGTRRGTCYCPDNLTREERLEAYTILQKVLPSNEEIRRLAELAEKSKGIT